MTSMVGSQSVFSSFQPISNELYQLVQDRLREVPRTNTLEDLRATMETLSTLSSAGESVLRDISVRDEEVNLKTAVNRVKNVLSWTKCMSFVLVQG